MSNSKTGATIQLVSRSSASALLACPPMPPDPTGLVPVRKDDEKEAAGRTGPRP